MKMHLFIVVIAVLFIAPGQGEGREQANQQPKIVVVEKVKNMGWVLLLGVSNLITALVLFRRTGRLDAQNSWIAYYLEEVTLRAEECSGRIEYNTDSLQESISDLKKRTEGLDIWLEPFVELNKDEGWRLDRWKSKNGL